MKIIFQSLLASITDQIEAAEIRNRKATAILLTKSEWDELRAELPYLLKYQHGYGFPNWSGDSISNNTGKTHDVTLKDGMRYRLLAEGQVMGVDVCVVPPEIAGKLK